MSDYTGSVAEQNAAVDNPGDHGTEQHCSECNGYGCPYVAEGLTLTLKIRVRRGTGPAKSTADILWALQNQIAGIEEFDVGGSDYQVENISYTTPTTLAVRAVAGAVRTDLKECP